MRKAMPLRPGNKTQEKLRTRAKLESSRGNKLNLRIPKSNLKHLPKLGELITGFKLLQ
jgi:hypothetical protein